MFAEFVWTILAAGTLTLLLALGALFVATVLGLALAYAKLSPRRWMVALAQSFTFVIRGVPDLVLMLLVFYSLPAAINQFLQSVGSNLWVEIPPFWAGLTTLGVIFSAYMSETFKSGLQNIPRGQYEAAAAYGLHPARILWRITLPQLARLALPGFTNNWLVLVKATALVSLLGLQDVMFRAKGAAEATGQPFTFYLVAGGFYLTVTLASTFALLALARRLERTNHAGRT